MKFSFGKQVVWVLLLCSVTAFSADREYMQQLKARFAEQAQSVFYKYKLDNESVKSTPLKKFPEYSREEVETFLKEYLGNWYDGYDKTIAEYIDFYTTQPDQYTRTWLGLMESEDEKIKTVSPELRNMLRSLVFSNVLLLSYEAKESSTPLSIPSPIAQHYNCQIDKTIDDRFFLESQLRVAERYLSDLKNHFDEPSFQLAAFVLGAATVRKAENATPQASRFEQVYPNIQHPSRDFYWAMCAAAFVWGKKEEWKAKGYPFSEIWETEKVLVNDTVYLEQVAAVLNLDKKEIKAYNPLFYNEFLLPGNTLVIPVNKKESFLLMKDSISSYKREMFFPEKEDSCYVFYRTNRGEYFRDLTRWFGPGLEEIKKTNDFSSNVLPKYWDVFFRVPCKDSAYFAAFDHMTRSQKDAAAKGEEVKPDVSTQKHNKEPVAEKSAVPTGAKKIVYVVKSGDTLWAIGQKYKVSDTDIMRWNNIGSRIQPGQKLTIYTR